jgi:hypothetical protein
MIAALDASNSLVTDLWGKSWSGINVNLLFGFAARAFHSHHDIAFVGHRWVTVRILPRGAARFTEPLLTGRLFPQSPNAASICERNLPLSITPMIAGNSIGTVCPQHSPTLRPCLLCLLAAEEASWQAIPKRNVWQIGRLPPKNTVIF